jgi:pimeloyl-ACP methyl ester carboxylesterase
MLSEQAVSLPRGSSQTVHRGGDGPPLLWLHGLGGVEPAGPLLEGLIGAGRTVIAPVAPGFADLAELAEIDDVHDLAIHYDDLLDALGLERAAVAGHSFGAMLAAEIAAHYPRRVEQLVLVSPLGLWNDEYPVADLFALTASEMPELLFADPASSAAAGVAAAEGDVEALVALAQSMTTAAKFLWPIPDRGLARRLPRITAPTLVLFGAEDRFVPPRYADDFAAAIPGTRSKLIDGAGHMLPVERPDEVLAAVGEFLGAGATA